MKFNEPTNQEIREQKLYAEMGLTDSEFDKINEILGREPNYTAVSYTHLTLPTKGHGCRSRWSPYH